MAYSQDHWERGGQIGVDCLLPNGIFISFQCQKNHTIATIKQMLWHEAKKQPLFHRLREADNYVFTYVTTKAKLVECVDENEQLDEIRPYKPIFKVVQKEGDRTLSILNNQIGEVIGKTVGEFENNKDSNVHDFRIKMIEKCRDAIKWRNECEWVEKMRYYFPPDVVSEEHVAKLLETYDPKNVQTQGGFLIQVHLTTKVPTTGKDQAQSSSYQFKPGMRVTTLISMVLSKKAKSAGSSTRESPEEYVLKVVGMGEFLFEDCDLLRYKYIKDCFQQQKSPQLTLVRKDSILANIPLEEFVQPQVSPGKPAVGRMSLWEMEGKFSCKVISASNLHIRKEVNVQVYAGIFHGEEGYQITHTNSVIQQGDGSNGKWVWNETLLFNQIEFKDLPPGARLCICIHAIYDDKQKKKKKGRGQQDKVALAWANIPLFDYRRQFITGIHNLYCWPVEDNLDEDLNYLGTVQPNPNTSDAPCLTIAFVENVIPVYYPDLQELLNKHARDSRKGSSAQRQPPMNKQLLEQWNDIVDKDPLSELLFQDKEYLWSYRHYCFSDHPEALPKLLSAVKWNEPSAVAEMYYLVSHWKKLDPELALELLDYKYQDPEVRKFAVECLKKMSDSELSWYTLQLVQAVKCESYLDCELAWFLLEKAWKNSRIGHYLFWHLRAEMDNPQVSLRFGLLLEAYCRGCPNHIRTLEKQTKALAKFKIISEMLRKSQEKKEKMREYMKSYFAVESTCVAVNDVDNVLNPRVQLGVMIIEQCKFFDSKMKPLLLTYTNRDKGDDRPIKVMFKSGDDLRQDMLTIQMLSIMDQLWQKEGVDLKMIPYGCLATGEKTGFIEIVQESETIATIQKRMKKVGGLWNSKLLMEWLKERNAEPSQWERAGLNFCHSCAGYCVATYVLGIGDRHSDNIMVTRDGQLFHVDFGHFLGNFKSKFGMKRERVPFVLADDFAIIIDRHMGFNAFAALCENAYLILRRQGYLFITLFAMMLQTGIPELRSIDDLNYMKDALALTVSEDQAKQYFRSKLQEARKKAWTTSMNWYIHGLAKDNSKV